MPGAGLAYPGITSHPDAEVAELVDALASGASGGIPVEVRVLFSAPCEAPKTAIFLALVGALFSRKGTNID